MAGESGFIAAYGRYNNHLYKRQQVRSAKSIKKRADAIQANWVKLKHKQTK
jgi:hypothetical protein